MLRVPNNKEVIRGKNEYPAISGNFSSDKEFDEEIDSYASFYL